MAPHVMKERRGTILVVDDEAAVREVARRALTRRGHEVLGAEDGLAALDVLQRRAVDAIVLDIVMPRMDGEALLEVLRAQRPALLSRVVVVTGYGTDEGAARARRLGVHDYLRKPYRVSELLWKVGQVLRLAALEAAQDPPVDAAGEALHERLTPRQLKVLLRVAAGKTLKWIAADLWIKARTARDHRLKGLRRMGMSETTEWTRYAVERRLIEREPSQPAVRGPE